MTSDDKKLGIKSWSEEDRPREKLVLKGPQALSDAELLAILIGSGSKEYNAVELAKIVLSKNENNLDSLGSQTIKQLSSVKGIGNAKAITIAAALELGRRRKSENTPKKPSINSSKDVFDYIYPFLADAKQEKFLILLLNRANHVIKKSEVSQGGISGTLVDPKVIFKIALEESSSSIILSHNHPSGNTKPSQADIDLTRKIKEGAKLLDINVLDHIIFTNHAYFSFADEGLL
ncbi:DNA repair protein RadC [Bacteroidota bacterium]